MMEAHSIHLPGLLTHASRWSSCYCSAINAIRSFMKALELITPVPPSKICMPTLQPSPLLACKHPSWCQPVQHPLSPILSPGMSHEPCSNFHSCMSNSCSLAGWVRVIIRFQGHACALRSATARASSYVVPPTTNTTTSCIAKGKNQFLHARSWSWPALTADLAVIMRAFVPQQPQQ